MFFMCREGILRLMLGKRGVVEVLVFIMYFNDGFLMEEVDWI